MEETDLEGHEYPRQDGNRSPYDWVWAWTCEKTFHARCGPRQPHQSPRRVSLLGDREHSLSHPTVARYVRSER
ncbi:hypothetical protein ABZY05_47860 [Streptomyces canus]|uniref:hypothetical protein n=1 Tax=Streptomyces canus TaxID=58343 RepID=UPI0033A31CC1